jgi:hypothetical protein
MNHGTMMLVLVALAAGAIYAGEPTSKGTPAGTQPVNPWANYRFAPDTLTETDLASATAWTAGARRSSWPCSGHSTPIWSWITVTWC